MSRFELKKAGVIVGPRKPEAIAVVCELASWCRKQGIELRAEEQIASQVPCQPLRLRQDELDEDLDLMVVLGGDGTMLGAARMIGSRNIPVLGVNFGWLGYLTEFTLEELFTALDGLREGNYLIEHRMLLDVSIERDGKRLETYRALNDAVVTKASPARMIDLECYVNDLFMNSFRADGMIVATPTGSTAYSLSAGGPIVHPSMSAILLTPICPHMLSNRPVVIPGDCSVVVVFKRPEEDVNLTIDGQLGISLFPQDRILVNRSATSFDVIRPTNRNYFEVLRTKLKWGNAL